MAEDVEFRFTWFPDRSRRSAQVPADRLRDLRGFAMVLAAFVLSGASWGAAVSPNMVAVPPPQTAAACPANCIYVDAVNGSDQNNGRSVTTAFRTMNKASSVVVPGSVVQVANGTYTSDGTVAPVEVYTSGTADHWITYQAAPGQTPVIQIPVTGTQGWGGFHLGGVGYIKIDGFEVIGTSKMITPQQGAANNGTQAFLNASCINVDGRGAFAGGPPAHDIMITNNTLHDCAGSGISTQSADSLTITYNKIYNNAFWTVYGGSGISLYHLVDANGSSIVAGYKNLVVGNLVYGNRNDYPTLNYVPVEITDGNGIIIDDNLHVQPSQGPNDLQGIPYGGRTYVANNVVYGNGGRGIHVYESSHVDVVNNTTYNNMLTNSPGIVFGEIDAQSSGSDISIVNNVAVNLNGKMINFHDNGYAYSHNVWNGTNIPYLGSADMTRDAVLSNPASGLFAPLPGSAALNDGTNSLAPTLDFAGKARAASTVDRGAIQVSSGSHATVVIPQYLLDQ